MFRTIYGAVLVPLTAPASASANSESTSISIAGERGATDAPSAPAGDAVHQQPQEAPQPPPAQHASRSRSRNTAADVEAARKRIAVLLLSPTHQDNMMASPIPGEGLPHDPESRVHSGVHRSPESTAALIRRASAVLAHSPLTPYSPQSQWQPPPSASSSSSHTTPPRRRVCGFVAGASSPGDSGAGK